MEETAKQGRKVSINKVLCVFRRLNPKLQWNKDCKVSIMLSND